MYLKNIYSLFFTLMLVLVLVLFLVPVFSASGESVNITNSVSVSASSGGNTVSGGETVEGSASGSIFIETKINGETIELIDEEVTSESGDIHIKRETEVSDGTASVTTHALADVGSEGIAGESDTEDAGDDLSQTQNVKDEEVATEASSVTEKSTEESDKEVAEEESEETILSSTTSESALEKTGLLALLINFISHVFTFFRA